MLEGAFIGAGSVASKHHLPCYRKLANTKIVAVCDASEKAAKRFSQKNGIPKVYTSVEELFENESLDFVDICTPPSTHYKLCSAAIEKGVAVLVEKPVTVSLSEAIELQDKSKKMGTVFCVSHNYRFKDNVLTSLKYYNGGKIGRIHKVATSVHTPGPFADWFWDETNNGGVLYESALHFLDIQTLFCGEHERIAGVHVNFDAKLGITTDVSAVVEYKSGATGIIDVTALSSSIWNRIDVYGTAADLHLKFFPDSLTTSLGVLTPYQELKGELRRFFGYTGTMVFRGKGWYDRKYHAKLIAGFVNAVETKSDPPVTIDSVLPVMKLLNDLRSSLKKEKPSR
ncbi:MAG: Gfo/Idh/MocA family protein [Candidatus Bathyarchaeia archaeon]